MRAGSFGGEARARAPTQREPVVQIRRELPLITQRSDTAVSLLPVQASPPEVEALTASASIEVVFRNATVRIRGAPESALLRVVLDTLARQA